MEKSQNIDFENTYTFSFRPLPRSPSASSSGKAFFSTKARPMWVANTLIDSSCVQRCREAVFHVDSSSGCRAIRSRRQLTFMYNFWKADNSISRRSNIWKAVRLHKKKDARRANLSNKRDLKEIGWKLTELRFYIVLQKPHTISRRCGIAVSAYLK